MFSIKIYNQFLDLAPNATLSFELNSPAYFGEDADVIQGGFSFPFTVPLTTHNKAILGHPNRIDNADLFLSDEYCEVWTKGVLLFDGKATIQSASRTTAKMYIIVSAISGLKELKLNQLNLGTASFGNNQTEALAHAKDTATNPGNYNYIFFPINNSSFFPSDNTGTTQDDYINWYDITAGSFVSNSTSRAIVPFLKLDHILQRGIDAISYGFTNNFQTDDELKRLVLYNNRSIHNGTDWALSTDLDNHANPETSFASLLKRISRLFCLAPFEDRWNKRIELLPLKNLIQNGIKHDWTRKASREYNKELNQNLIGGLQYGDMYDTGDPFFSFESDPPVYNLIQDIIDVEDDAPSGYWYEYSTDTLYYNKLDSETDPESGDEVPRQVSERVSKFYLPYLIDGSTNKVYTSEMNTILSWQLLDSTNSATWMLPLLWEEGCFIFDPDTGVPTTSDPLKSFKPFEDRILFYRGFQTASPSGTYPMASNNTFDYFTDDIPGEQYSLLWNDHLSTSLYNVWWKDWLEILRLRKVVSFQLLLTPRDILEFNFKDKVRIDNQNYLVKRLRVTLTMRGLQPTEAELVSVV